MLSDCVNVTSYLITGICVVAAVNTPSNVEKEPPFLRMNLLPKYSFTHHSDCTVVECQKKLRTSNLNLIFVCLSLSLSIFCSFVLKQVTDRSYCESCSIITITPRSCKILAEIRTKLLAATSSTEMPTSISTETLTNTSHQEDRRQGVRKWWSQHPPSWTRRWRTCWRH